MQLLYDVCKKKRTDSRRKQRNSPVVLLIVALYTMLVHFGYTVPLIDLICDIIHHPPYSFSTLQFQIINRLNSLGSIKSNPFHETLSPSHETLSPSHTHTCHPICDICAGTVEGSDEVW